MAFSSLMYKLLLLSILTTASSQNDCTFPAKSVTKEAHTCCDFPDRLASGNIFEPCSGAANGHCLVECIFNVTNIFEKEEINSENLKTHLEREIIDKREFIPLGINSVEECYLIAKNKLKELKTKSIKGCSILPAMIMECSYAKIFIDCPPNYWKTSSNCDEMKAFYKKCPMPSEIEFN